MATRIHIHCDSCSFDLEILGMAPAVLRAGEPVPISGSNETIEGFLSQHLCPSCFRLQPLWYPLKKKTRRRQEANIQGMLSYLEGSDHPDAPALKEAFETALAEDKTHGPSYRALLDRFEVILNRDRDRKPSQRLTCDICGVEVWSPDDVTNSFYGVMKGSTEDANGVGCPECEGQLIWDAD